MSLTDEALYSHKLIRTTMNYTLSARIRPGFTPLLTQAVESIREYLALEDPNGDPMPGYPPEFQYFKFHETGLISMSEQPIEHCQPEYVLQFLSPFVIPGAVLEEEGETRRIFKLNDKGEVVLMTTSDNVIFVDPPIKPMPDAELMYEFIASLAYDFPHYDTGIDVGTDILDQLIAEARTLLGDDPTPRNKQGVSDVWYESNTGASNEND